MSELDQLRQEAEQLKNQIRVSPSQAPVLYLPVFVCFLVRSQIQIDILSIKFCATDAD